MGVILPESFSFETFTFISELAIWTLENPSRRNRQSPLFLHVWSLLPSSALLSLSPGTWQRLPQTSCLQLYPGSSPKNLPDCDKSLGERIWFAQFRCVHYSSLAKRLGHTVWMRLLGSHSGKGELTGLIRHQKDSLLTSEITTCFHCSGSPGN